MKTGYSEWRKLDNAALAFPSVTGKNDSRVFRFYCELKETVKEQVLQQALDETMKKYPLFQAVLRKGLFWFYLERRELRAVVCPEWRPPCSRLYIPDQKSLLFEVSYYQNRINFEVFHALTDGTGAMHFLEELVKNYLELAHPEVTFEPLTQEEVTQSDLEEDSFSQYYSKKIPKMKEHSRAAVRLNGRRLAQEDMNLTELVLPVQETLAKARACGVSITVLLTAMLLCAIREEVPKDQRKPIGIMIPVNLRNYFPSQSMTNFFGWIEVQYQFQEDTTFEAVLADVNEQFKKELSKERIAMRMNDLVRLEKLPILRLVPLELKTLFLQAGASLGGRGITAVYSNIGVVKMPQMYEAYIEHFGFFASTNGLQVCSCSYGDKMVIDFTSKIPGGSIERNFTSQLKAHDVPNDTIEDKFPKLEQRGKKEGVRFFQILTFLCIAAAIVCGMVDFMMDQKLSWAWLAAGGIFCSWLVTTVAYRKRRNLLKNEMWQLTIISGAGLLWDLATGWQGWSIDYLLPFASLAVLCSMGVIILIWHLQPEEYMIYEIQASTFGLIPLVLLLCRVIRVVYPSVICVGISLLVLAWLFVFQHQKVMEELHKKMRL